MIGRLLRVSGVIVVLVWAVSASASGERGGDHTAGTSGAMRESGPKLPLGRPKAMAQSASGSKRLYVATETGLFTSDDKGHHWDRLRVAPLTNGRSEEHTSELQSPLNL